MTTHIIGSRNPKIEVRTSLDGILMTPAEIAEQAKAPTTPPSPPNANVPPTTNPAIVPPIVANPSQTNLPFWTIPRVNYRGVVGNVDVQKELLNTGITNTQNDWAVYTEQSRANGGFYTPDYPLLYATLERAFELKDESAHKQQVEEMRTTLKKISRANWLMTLTRIKYTPKGKDNIIHNFGLRDKYELLEDFVGADGELPAGSPVKVYQTLLGTQKPLDKINEVFNWLNDTTSNYIWRVNAKPKTADERIAGFYAYSNGASLNCDRFPSGSSASLGVRFASPIGRASAPKIGGQE